MTLALLAMSHSPLLEHAELDTEVTGELEAAFGEARRFAHDYDPDVIVNFAPDHYNSFFYRLMPPFAVSTCQPADCRILRMWARSAGWSSTTRALGIE